MLPLTRAAPLALFGLRAGERPRAWLRRVLDGWLAPSTARMRAVLDAHARSIAQLLDPDACARRLCRTLREGLEAESVCVFLAAGRGWRLVDAHGNRAPITTAAAEAAVQLLVETDLLYLADALRHGSPVCVGLRGLGIEVAARLHSGGDTLGVALLGRSCTRLPYSSSQLAFLRSALALTAVATHRAGLARRLLEAERFATLGRVGAGLVHDLGKPLGVVETLAARLHAQTLAPEQAQRDVRTIAALAGEMRSALRAFLGAAALEAGGDSELAIAALVDRAIRRVGRGRAGSRVAVRLAPGLPRLRAGGDELVRVLANLVDNALQASAPADEVSVSVSERAGRLCIEVRDRGCGMDAAIAARAFEPFFTTRAASGGSGLGLAVCRDLVGSLGGTIELGSAPGAGTRVRVSLPLALRGAQARAPVPASMKISHPA